MLRTIVSTFLCLSVAATAVRADVADDFSTNPLTNPQILKQGPDAPNVATRFTYDSGAQTLTAHYDSTLPTVKLVFPLGQHLTQNNSFSASTTFTIQSNGYVPAPYVSAQAPSFGLINAATTGSNRATTGHFDTTTFEFSEITQGDTYNIMTLDYYPSVDQTYGGDSLNLTTVQGSQVGAGFNSRVNFAYTNATLPFDQSITATISYSAATHLATLNYGSGEFTSDLTGKSFDLDAFAITLWNDPNLNPLPPADPSGGPVAGAVVFDGFTVTVPEPASLGLLLSGATVLLLRRRHHH